LAGLAALGTVAYFGSHMSAQTGGVQQTGATQPPAVAPLRTKIALINLTSVVKQYKKWTNFQEEMKGQVAGYEKALQAKQTKLEEMKTRVLKDPSLRDQLEKEAKVVQREIQDINEEAKVTLGKKEGDQIVIIYKEVRSAAEAYAKAHDIELVMHYNDVISKEDLDLPSNVQRKFTTGACMPIVMHPSMDISNDVIWMLNNYYQRSMPATQTAPQK